MKNRNAVSRRGFLRATAQGGAAVWLANKGLSRAAESEANSPKRPNILFIMVDEMRWDAMGCAGHPVVRTPNLDRLARQGVLFANSYSVAPVCCPARRTLFTGRYAHVHGVTGNNVPANDGELLLPSILRHYGYVTAISGKLHFHPVKSDYGFDYFWSYGGEGPGKLESYPEYLARKHGSPNKYPQKPGSCPWPNDFLGKDVGEFLYPKEDFESFWITDRAIEFLEARKGEEKPWFLFASYLIPHSPFTAPEPYYSMYPPDSFDVPTLPEGIAEERARRQGISQRSLIDNEAMLRDITAQYYGHITNVDDNVGRLLGALEQLGMAGDTIVVFTADHGNMLGDRGRMFKGVMYEGSAHIPHIMRAPLNCDWAERFNGRQPVDEIVENVDVMPTLMEMAGLPIPDGVQGRSCLSLVIGQDAKWKNRCFASLATAMLRTPQWKLIDNSSTGDGPFELYDMIEDPKETRNLANDPAHAEMIREMAAQIKAWKADTPPPISIAGLPAPDYLVLSAEERQAAYAAAKVHAQRRASKQLPGARNATAANRRQ